MIKHLLLIFALLIPCFASQAQVTNGLVREPRAMAMGGAGVALAAGLAGSETRRFRLIGLSLEASADTYSTFKTSLDTFKNFKIASLNELMGKNIALRASMVPMIQLPHFALTYLVDFQGSINEFNRANPTFTVGDMTTHGVQAGLGWNLAHGRHSTEEMRVGIAGKVLWRKGGAYDVSTAGFLQAASDGKKYLDNLIGDYGMGFGADVGFQYIKHVDEDTKVYFGSSITDIAGTKFSDPHAAEIPMNMSVGIGAERQLEIFNMKFDFDLRNLSQETSFANKTHFGVDLGLPLFDLYFGLNQFNVTFGASFDIWILKVSAMSYAEEYGITFHQDTSRKYLVQIDFGLPI
jgi:hypothetical protein